jgi:CelD/BcsL family acetyltransferase involved in cellulose biosynthesis
LKFIDGGVSDINAPVLFPSARNLTGHNALSLWRRVQGQLPHHDLVQLQKMPELVEDWPNPLNFLFTGPHREGHYSMTLPKDWNEDAKKKLPKLSDSRRRLRKLRQLGSVSFVISKSQVEAQEILSELMRMKSAQYLRTRGRDRFLVEPGAAEYYSEATKVLLDTGTVHLSAVKLDSHTLAAHWGYIVGGRFYHLMPAFAAEEVWRPYAPGRLLNEFLMEWAATKGLTVFDFGIGDEPYKIPYSDSHEVLHDAIVPVTALGHSYSILQRATVRARSVVKGTRIEAPLRHALRSIMPLLPFA